MVLGRVLTRARVPPKKATVELVGERDQPVKDLGAIPVDREGWARKPYPAELVAKLADRKLVVSAAVRIGQRIVATDTARVAVRGDTLYQFDLRVDVAE
jgi:hypothetical protein